jgi:hypothetical protein
MDLILSIRQIPHFSKTVSEERSSGDIDFIPKAMRYT